MHPDFWGTIIVHHHIDSEVEGMERLSKLCRWIKNKDDQNSLIHRLVFRCSHFHYNESDPSYHFQLALTHLCYCSNLIALELDFSLVKPVISFQPPLTLKQLSLGSLQPRTPIDFGSLYRLTALELTGWSCSGLGSLPRTLNTLRLVDFLCSHIPQAVTQVPFLSSLQIVVEDDEREGEPFDFSLYDLSTQWCRQLTHVCLSNIAIQPVTSHPATLKALELKNVLLIDDEDNLLDETQEDIYQLLFRGLDNTTNLTRLVMRTPWKLDNLPDSISSLQGLVALEISHSFRISQDQMFPLPQSYRYLENVRYLGTGINTLLPSMNIIQHMRGLRCIALVDSEFFKGLALELYESCLARRLLDSLSFLKRCKESGALPDLQWIYFGEKSLPFHLDDGRLPTMLKNMENLYQLRERRYSDAATAAVSALDSAAERYDNDPSAPDEFSVVTEELQARGFTIISVDESNQLGYAYRAETDGQSRRDAGARANGELAAASRAMNEEIEDLRCAMFAARHGVYSRPDKYLQPLDKVIADDIKAALENGRGDGDGGSGGGGGRTLWADAIVEGKPDWVLTERAGNLVSSDRCSLYPARGEIGPM